jgi:cytoskeletal protein RodZ
MKSTQTGRATIFVVLGFAALGLCVCMGIAAAAGYLFLGPAATPSVAISPQASASLSPSTTPTPTRRPSLTPLPGQEAHFPTQTVLALTQTVAAGYSPTPPSLTPTKPHPTYTPGPTSEPTRVKVTFAAHTPGSACNPAYPTLCLTYRVTCQQIGISNFPVLPPDPFGYDKDGDGKGCDS